MIEAKYHSIESMQSQCVPLMSPRLKILVREITPIERNCWQNRTWYKKKCRNCCKSANQWDLLKFLDKLDGF